jgi:RHS repeat-associated protein
LAESPTSSIQSFEYGNQLGYQRVVDSLGRVVNLTISDRDTRVHRDWAYTPSGNVAQIYDRLEASNDRHYAYDPLQRLTGVADPINSLIEYRYDANGNRLGVNTTDYVIADDSNRLAGTVSADGDARVYDYDAAGNQQLSATDDETLTYAYDQQSRLSQVSSEAGSIASYQYNGLGQRVYKSTASGDEYSLYSPDGKRIATLNGSGALLQNTLYWQQEPLAKFEPAEDERDVYRFSSSSWLFWKPSASLDLWPDKKSFSLTRYNGSALTLDFNDSQWRQERFFGHDLISIDFKGSNRLTVTGWIKLETDKSNGLPHHSRIPSELMLIVNQPGRLAEIYTMKGQLEERREPTLNTYYYHNDHLGTPQLMTDSQQEVVWQASYDAFGLAGISVDKVKSDLRFPGQYFDGETGLHYNYYRDYDSTLGRYVQSDPIGLRGGLNTYLYVNANPLIYADPDGLTPGLGGRRASAMEAAGNAINQGICGWWPGHPECWSMCVRWRCERDEDGDGGCGKKEYYYIGRGYPYVSSHFYDPNNDNKCQCTMRCARGQQNCRGLNVQ